MKFGNFPSIDIKINDIGIYFLDEDGGTGKTYLFKSLKKLLSLYKSYLITYDSNNVVKFGDSNNCNIIFYDRLDMYISDMIVKDIVDYSKKCIVLLDLKNTILLEQYLQENLNVGIGFIRLTREGIVVE